MSPTTANPCPPPSNLCLAVVTLRGSTSYVIRDLTDITHPKTVSSFDTVVPQFISANDVSYVSANSVIRRDWRGSAATTIVSSSQGIRAYAWSPDGNSLVYVTEGNPASVHLLSARVDKVIGSIPAGGVGGCEVIASCAIPNWLDSQLFFTATGMNIVLEVNSFSGSVFRIWSSDGIGSENFDGQGFTMATWSGGSPYFRDGTGVDSWAGPIGRFIPGVLWIKPKGSPAGGQIVFTARDSKGWGRVFVVDTSTRKVRQLKTARTDAVFLTSRYIWYRGERACVAADRCGPNPPFHPLSGKTYIYDLQDGTETESIITNVLDIWPHAA